MKKIPVLIIFFILYQSCASAQATGKQSLVDQIPDRKPLVLQTQVVNGGKPNAIIVTPNTPEFKNLASKVQQAIKAATGTKLEIVDVKNIANVRGEFPGQSPAKNIITLGSLQNNGLIAHLYFRGYCSVDANYPGKDGYVVQTICDPWATNANVIVLGGSNTIGVAKATERFCNELPKDNTLTIARNLRAVVHKNYNYPDLTDAEIAKVLVSATADFKAGKHNGLFPFIVGAGNAYKLSGKEGQAKLFRELLFLEYNLRWHSPNDFDSPWGSGADMQFAPLMMAWDNVEESSSLSDADRHKIMDIILEYIHYYEKYSYIPYFKTKLIRHNHHTFPGQGFSAAGRYFTKYYPDYPGGAQWQQMGDDCFRVQETSWKSMENCSAYAGLASRHMCYYATTRPDFTWFDSGRARISGDLPILTMDNLGSQCAYGDMLGYNPRSPIDLWTTLVLIERNGRYSWAIHKARGSFRPVPSESDSIAVDVKPVIPVDLLGTKYYPVDSLFFATLNGKGKVPLSKTFDKISFRSSFDPQKQYLSLEGINTGYHSHRDGNAVLRLTDRGRIWLADGDYIKASAKYHNTLLIFKDGEATVQPPFIQKEFIADLPSVGISSTTMPDYGGTNWTRNIIWDKERAFVFIDEVKANSKDSYSVRTLWHTLGKPELKDNTFHLTQQGEAFAIQNLDGSQLHYTKDYAVGSNWIEYKHADPVVNSLQQVHNATLRKGDRVFVLNVLSGQTEGSEPIVSARVNDSTLILGSGKDQALMGVGELKVKGIEATTKLYWLTHDHLALVGAKGLTLNGKKLFSAVDSISAEISGAGITLDIDKPTQITLYAPKAGIMLDGAPVKGVAKNGAFMVYLPKGKHRITGIIIPREFAFDFPKIAKVESHAKVDLGAGKLMERAGFTPENARDTIRFDADKSGVYVADNNGVLHAFTTDMKVRWTYNVGGNIHAVWTGKLEKDAPARIVAGTVAGHVVVLDQDGKLLREMQIPLYRNTRQTNYFTSADLKGDGNRELIVGAQNWYNYAFDAAGNMLWKYLCVHPASVGGAFDLNGDGKDEVLSGTIYYTWGALNPDDGKPVWTIRAGPGANDVIGGDMDGKGKRMVFMAGADGYVYAVNANGKQPWTNSVGDGATCIQLMDVNGDGEKDVLVGAVSADVTAFDSKGKRIWRHEIGEPIQCMAKADMNDDGKEEIIIGTEDGHVIALNSEGKPIAHWATSGSVIKLIALPDGRIAAGTSTGKLAILGRE
ncbi:outer membrane protein assembly factor BamB family protein [Mucilaginibacter boryungensis]|uniref:PQQ-binding-like beta-propeller repeat protein n=1 Tax=Mucilaginibacter boryungensis TaxID=768480 RepID=A0ABR9XE68_9SPHI|nr:PQQ-binding-like beta-propeller repeat protein [Mucilaginibacter boryungensis]MBE9665490.1 PQQ-binding-like beta-propeller repeat protein [Mucilaginibacter boryungensis]